MAKCVCCSQNTNVWKTNETTETNKWTNNKSSSNRRRKREKNDDGKSKYETENKGNSQCVWMYEVASSRDNMNVQVVIDMWCIQFYTWFNIAGSDCALKAVAVSIGYYSYNMECEWEVEQVFFSLLICFFLSYMFRDGRNTRWRTRANSMRFRWSAVSFSFISFRFMLLCCWFSCESNMHTHAICKMKWNKWHF